MTSCKVLDKLKFLGKEKENVVFNYNIIWIAPLPTPQFYIDLAVWNKDRLYDRHNLHYLYYEVPLHIEEVSTYQTTRHLELLSLSTSAETIII